MFKHFMILPFIAGVILGIFGIYFMKPEATIVFKYPTPENTGKLTYKDKNGVCYQYAGKDVSCDANEAKLKTYPLD
jgi:hypothetical protein